MHAQPPEKDTDNGEDDIGYHKGGKKTDEYLSGGWSPPADKDIQQNNQPTDDQNGDNPAGKYFGLADERPDPDKFVKQNKTNQPASGIDR